MTNEEATKIIKNYDVYSCGYCHQGGDEVEEAFNMAIKALEQEPKVKKIIKMRDATPEERESIYKYIKSISKPTGVDFFDLEQEPCEDCISRQAVIEQLNMYCKNNCKYTEAEQDVMCRACDTGSCIELIEDAPSVTPTRPKNEWIPVSERLPEDDEDVLVQMTDYSMMVDFRTASSSGWFWAEKDDLPIAWMPLPEPYKAGEEE